MVLPWFTLLLASLTWVLGEWPGERTLPTLLLAYAPPLLWVGATLPALLWTHGHGKGRRVAWAALLVATWGAGALHLRPQAEGALRVVTFNVLGGQRATPIQLGRALAALNADVILLQESRFATPEGRALLTAALPGYRAEHAAEVTTLTRLPLLDVQVWPLPANRREVLLTRLSWQGRPLGVVNAHLGTVQVSSVLTGDLERVRRTRDARDQQVRLLRDIAAQSPGLLLLGGDLNTPPRGRTYRELRTAFGPDAHDQAGRGPGWTFPPLLLRIDHVMGRGLTPRSARVLPWALSDHRPLLVTFDR
ncbi:endonuclease/exonuclease/phosphatase family protein [Deinococcus taeanensis]|uniref:endonuclease/exonuclease/phosphatase family protein n=1 Tax=Deinococcus taeanensis TaxID=2737050 RepID=UPI001CDD013D|nr:endonuclease/exonuclease/phosphatase family protein [Deinococcus taeanensis]UBV43085.1 endonuclease/exonuclease/phosphatase family protein [Deinococcus taeanensis]